MFAIINPICTLPAYFIITCKLDAQDCLFQRVKDLRLGGALLVNALKVRVCPHSCSHSYLLKATEPSYSIVCINKRQKLKRVKEKKKRRRYAV